MKYFHFYKKSLLWDFLEKSVPFRSAHRRVFFQVVVILYFAKSALNPLIYGWKNRDFRVAFIRLLRTIPTLRSIKTLSGTRLQHQTSAVATLELASSDGHERNHVDIPISPLQEQPHVEGIVNDFAC
jgi:predicted ferric reductase